MLRIAVVSALVVLAACSRKEGTVVIPEPEAGAPPITQSDPLTATVAGDWRSAEDRSRDEYRHPQEALEFWGLQPGMTILEVQPGGGWWTEILAPYAHATGGKYYATAADLNNPELSEGARKSRAEFRGALCRASPMSMAM